MTPNKARGRPKGTGLNDAAQLRAIAGLMAADPGLRPTTAIKTLGITDPSVIRRLRDKYSAAERELMAEIAPELPFGSEAAAPTAPVAVEPARPAIAQHAKSILVPEPNTPAARAEERAPMTTPVVTAPVAQAMAQAGKPAATTPAHKRLSRPLHLPKPSETELPKWIGVGLSLYAFNLETQRVLLGTLMEWTPLAATLKTQLALTEAAIAMTSPLLAQSAKS